ncbi:MAG TPA: RNA polymerase sigma factor [Methylomirabilota bacterium]|nr:RNA polymerase sigma factor [Methylomirabilota bacterium]
MASPTSTFELVERFKNGDKGAFSQLFRLYHHRLAVSVYYRMSAELHAIHEVDDVLQEIFLRASRDMDRFTYRSPGSLMAWLLCIADRVIVDSARHEKREKRRAEEMVRLRSDSNPTGPEPADSNTPSRLFAREEAFQVLLKKLDALPGDYRQVILLSKFEGMTTQEVAERMGKSRESVALLLHRAIKRFREVASGRES